MSQKNPVYSFDGGVDTHNLWLMDRDGCDVVHVERLNPGVNGHVLTDDEWQEVIDLIVQAPGKHDHVRQLLAICVKMRDRLTKLANAADACWLDWPDAYEVDKAIAAATGQDHSAGTDDR